MFWDKLKPVAPEARPVAIDVAQAGTIVVTWNDGEESKVDPFRLRLDCPCAACIDEWTGAKLIDPAGIRRDVRPVAMEPVGNYAVQIRWSDGHETGLYSWQRLRAYRSQG